MGFGRDDWEPPFAGCGQKARDAVTGIEGVITAKHVYSNGCIRYSLSWQQNGEPKDMGVDEQDVELLDERQDVERTAKAGGPRRDPHQMR